jgi:photosystem II stability/assembly factor-like uncharacterized protein
MEGEHMQRILGSLDFRCIGPTRGGRVVTVAGDPQRVNVFYFGSTGGGVWKSDDAGQYWENVSDGYFKRASVGAIAVAPSDSNVIYAGMGESTIRGNVSHGDGVYKSTDGGRTWRQLGLEQTRHIGRIAVHPADSDLVYVAAFGHAHGPNAERGLYRSKDGGKTWDLILHRNERTGANFVALDPNNPRHVWVCFWEAERGPHYLNSGGPGSSIFKSTDGGDSWEEMTGKPGMPEGNKGKMEVALAARAGRVWAIVEADAEKQRNGVYRSDDGGETWQQLSSDTNLTGRPWYFNHIRADPVDPETVWVLNFEIWKSVDGGKSWQVMAGPHADYHDLWFDPANPRRMILGGDGGGCVSLNGGESWSTIYNQPTGEFYHATVDSRFPYRVYGAQQDNTSMSVPSRSDNDAIILSDWYEIGGGESGYIAVRPDNPNVVIAGAQQGILTRYDHERKTEQDIAVWPESTRGWGSEDFKFRTNWTSPTVIAPHDPNTLYYGSHVVHRSNDDGRRWEVISDDLTRADPETLHASGGEITKDNSGAEVYATVFTLAVSAVDPNVIWAGSDDGLVHVSRDGGQTWQGATPATIPDWALMSIIEASPHDAATAYLAATRYKLDDFHPYLYKTNDYGQTWQKITSGIPDDDFTRVIREDPTRRGLLYAGTETGIHVSFDDGGNWQRVNSNPAPRVAGALPVVPIHDLIVKDDELVICTHGRSFWVLDDLTLIRQLAAEDASSQGMHLFRPKDAIRSKRLTGFGNTEVKGRNYLFVGGIVQTYVVKKDASDQSRRLFLDAGNNPADGVVVYYWLKEKPKEEISLTFLDSRGNEIRTFRSKVEDETAKDEEDDKEPSIPAVEGLNRFVWDMRYLDATKLDAKGGDQPGTAGPRVVPGDYQARLAVGNATSIQPFSIVQDPRYATTQDEYQAQLDLLLRIRDKLSETNAAINRIRAMRAQVDGWVERAKGSPAERDIDAAAKPVKDRLAAVEEQLIQVKAKSPKDALNFPVMLNSKLGRVAGAVASADARPTQQAYDAFDDLAARIDRQLAALQQVVDDDVPAFNTAIQSADLDPIVVGPS